MSERVRLIRASQIRQGDLIRIEFGDTEEHETAAVEYVASMDGYCGGWDLSFTDGKVLLGRAVWLLDRKVVLPDAPYSLVVPPVKDQESLIPRVLQYEPGGKLSWYKGGTSVGAKHVEDLVRDGWRIIPGQAVAEGNNIEENTK